MDPSLPGHPPRGRLGTRLTARLRAAASAPGRVVRRFPLPAAAAAATLVLLLRALSGDQGPGEGGADYFPPVALGIPLFLALRLAGERGVWHRITGGRRGLEALLTLAVAAGLGAFLLAWTAWPDPIRVLRYGQLFLASHLLVAVLPFVLDPEGFRPFNRHLLLRVLEGSLQAVVLFAGISVAFLALDNLFGLRIPGESYLRLGALLLTGYLPLHVLAGITFTPERDDPRALQAAGRWILVPLASLYLVILGAYLVQVLVTQSWPSGWIGWLVAWMAVVGILSVLLVRPADPAPADPAPADPSPAKPRDDRWILWWERAFWILMIPAAGMFLAALARRIGQYGVTEPRYLGVVLGGWLLVMAGVFGLSRLRDLRLLPGTLALVLVLTMAGPWGMTGFSERSQTARLTDLLAQPEPRDEDEVRAVLDYLYQTHPTVSLDRVLGPAWTAAVTLPTGVTLRPSDAALTWRDQADRTDATLLALGMRSPRFGPPGRALQTGRVVLVREGATPGPRRPPPSATPGPPLEPGDTPVADEGEGSGAGEAAGHATGQGIPIRGFDRAAPIFVFSPPTVDQAGERPPVVRPPALDLRVGDTLLQVALVHGGADEPWLDLVAVAPSASGLRSIGEEAGPWDPDARRDPHGAAGDRRLVRFDLSPLLAHPALPADFVELEGDAWEEGRESGEPRFLYLDGLGEAAFLLDGELLDGEIPGAPTRPGNRAGTASAAATLPDLSGIRFRLVLDQATILRERSAEGAAHLRPIVEGSVWLLIGEG